MPRVDPALARDWVEWHAAYDDPGNPHARRLAIVRRRVAEALDAAPAGRLDVISMCAGEGRDLLEVLEHHPRAADVRARLVELDPRNVAVARGRAAALAGASVDVVEGDAGATDAYAGAVPAHLALVCGVWGNVPDADVEGTIGALPSLLADRGTVIWTRHRRPPDLTPAIRGWLAAAGFAELAFDAPDDAEFSVGAARLTSAPRPFEPGRRLFAFTVREEPVDELPIGLARPDEAAAILELQRLAYRSEVARYPRDDIPPARQTLEELQAQMAGWTFLVARLDGAVVGSVRARVRDDGTADVGRLIVHPRLQGRGLGTRLLVAVEAALPAARRFELFTGHRSARNLALYERLGYRRCGERRVSDTLSLVYLAKDGAPLRDASAAST
jgi:RimJ/RimL family protein N-acetyltransferase